jgi:hypothetical protein
VQPGGRDLGDELPVPAVPVSDDPSLPDLSQRGTTLQCHEMPAIDVSPD